ncbi:lipid A-modifier LpxR family protein [Undibacterium sp. WLHG33]|uniref:lipid A-modifier LpxR family protein n=1 Tax=Undibacterium sp. WLHG33 TaxID=3412482 RepID=UPI003C2D3F7B
MMTSKKIARVLSAMSLLSLASLVYADESTVWPSWSEFVQVRESGKSIWQLEIENDSLLMNKDDRFYTAGNHLQQGFVRQTATQSTEYGWRVGQDLYTSSDIKLQPSQLAPNDHPYAAWLYAGVFGQKTQMTGRSWRWSVDVGCLGPCAGGEWTQNHLHRILQQPQPQAWSTQLRNEWGMVLGGEMSPGRLLPFEGVDMSPRFKARFGNIFTDASAQLELRAGHLNSLPYQPANYAFARAEAKVVGYNATIQGGYFNNEPGKLTPKRYGGEIELGYLWQAEKYAVSASLLRRANEIKQISDATGAQNFVRLQFSYAM